MNQPHTAEAAINDLMQVASNDPSMVDVWVNDSDNRYVIAVHGDHKGGNKVYMRELPDGTRKAETGGPALRAVLKFEPRSETSVPREYRNDIQVVQCRDPGCAGNPATRGRCPKDHPGVVIGGKCPSLRRKGTENHIHIPAAFDSSLVERRKIDASGRVFYELEKPEDIEREKAAFDAVNREHKAADRRKAAPPIKEPT